LLDLINAPSRLLFQRPLIGDGRNGTSPGQAGESGGILFGNGGTGGPGAPGGRGGDGGIFFGNGGAGAPGSKAAATVVGHFC
jgi:hypothetical protein